MIVADTFRRDHLGAYGNSTIRTPHLDQLAASSIVFDQHRISSFPTMPAPERWLERHHDKPFFLYVDTWDPHEPWDPPDYYSKLYRPDFQGPALYPAYAKWKDAGITKDQVDIAHAAYCGKVTMVDRWIGMLLNKLEVLGIADNTIVVFTSDHGHYFGEHEYFGKAEWIHDPDAVLSADADVPTWFSKSWLLTIGWSPLYQELYRSPFFLPVPVLN